MRRLVAASVLALAAAAGCGPTGKPSLATPVAVTGKISFADGRPVPSVKLYFLPADAPAPAYAKVKEDGTFDLTTYENKAGICKGKYVVFVQAINDTPADSAKSAPVLQAIPGKYKDDAGMSPIQIEIKSSGQVLDLKIEA